MQLREYRTADLDKLAELFYQTVHSVNARDYTEEQLNVWATGRVDLQKWDDSLREHKKMVAIQDGEIVGFGDMDSNGYLDRLYVHKDHQRQGIASVICDELEHTIKGSVVTHASITAKPFFLNRGYHIVRKQQVIRDGVALTNYVMEKEL